MAAKNDKPLIVIAGPTASGKTSLALKLAKKYNGEIICADSRTVYKGMDIGTAKPTPAQQQSIKHHLLDIVEPGETFTAADFKELASKAIKEIRNHNKVSFVVGGTGLYIDSLVFDYRFGPKSDANLRNYLNSLKIEELWVKCEEHNIPLPHNKYNKRHVIRALEQKGVNHKRNDQPIENCIIVGIATDKESLRARIAKRAEEMFSSGVIKEASDLSKKYGWDSEAMTGNIYRLLRQVLSGEITEAEAREKFITTDWRLAKRQITWLKRNPYIKWLNLEEAEQYISNIL